MIASMDSTFIKWNSLDAKLRDILKALNTVKNGQFTIDVEYRKGLTPEVRKDGSISHDFMDGLSGPYYDNGYDIVLLYMNDYQKQRLGIRPSLNGAAQNDTDMVGEAYVMCDENEKRGAFNKFVQTTLHEIRHILKRGVRQEDDTHAIHGGSGDIRGHFGNIDMLEYEPKWYNLKAQVGFLERAVRLLIKSFAMKKTLYQAALESLNFDVSPKDRAADVVGCAESASEVIRKVLPDFPIILGTYSLWQFLSKDTRFKKVALPMPGDIIICPTGTGNGKFPGHVGIFLAGNKIASNTSANGKFEQNYTLESWKKRWEVAGGFPVYYYSLIK